MLTVVCLAVWLALSTHEGPSAPAATSWVDNAIDALLNDDVESFIAVDHGTDDDKETKFYGNDRTHFGRFAGGKPTVFSGFETLGDLVRYIEAFGDVTTRNHGRWAGWSQQDNKWSGTNSMGEAIRLATEGWPEGVENASRALEIITGDHAQVPRRSISMTGGRVNIGRMLSGDPMHMTRRKRQPGSKVVTLFVNIAASAIIEASSLAIRSAVVAAMCDALEQSGFSCEIIAYDIGKVPYGSHQLTVTLKRAGEALDLETLVFTMGHPAMLRRLSFATMSVPELRFMWSTFGMPTEGFTKNHKVGPNEFHISELKVNARGSDFASQVREMFPLIVPEGFPISLKG